VNHKEQEQIEEMYCNHGYKCFVTSKPATQRAHIIGNTKANILKYGKEIINNPLNWLPAHSLKENALIDIGCNSEISDFLAFAIEHNNSYIIEKTVRENIERKLRK
jgi:hypothetical protein